MRLLFYFVPKMSHGKIGYIEREAKPDIEDGRVVGYSFEKVEEYGRPFDYIKSIGIGRVFEEGYSYMLVVEDKDKDKAISIWCDYFDGEINKARSLIKELENRKELVKSNELFLDETIS